MDRRSFLSTLAAVPLAAIVPACPAAPIARVFVGGKEVGGAIAFKFDPILTDIALQYMNKQDRYFTDIVFPVIEA